MATAPLALTVQGNHEHRDVVVGHLPFPCGAVILPLCAVYQHLGQLREPVETILQMYSGARAEARPVLRRTHCTGVDTWGPKQQYSPPVGPGKLQTWEGHRLDHSRLDPEIFGIHCHPHP